MKYGRVYSKRCSICGTDGRCSCMPIETPGHNGPYRGKAKVKVIPPATFGEDFKPHTWGLKATKGHLVQSRLAIANRRDKQGRFE